MAVYTKENAGAISGKVPPRMKDRYVQRIKKVEVGRSKSEGKNPMITLVTEIIEPQTKKFDGVDYDLTGLENKYYLILVQNLKEPKKNHIAKAIDLCDRLGVHEKGIDPVLVDTPEGQEELAKPFRGLCIESIIDSFEDKAQKPDPEKPGQFIDIVDADGKPISRGWKMTNNIQDILGRSATQIDDPTV